MEWRDFVEYKGRMPAWLRVVEVARTWLANESGDRNDSLRVDRVEAEVAPGRWEALNGSIVVMRQGGRTSYRTLAGPTTRIGVHLLWLVDRCGYGHLVKAARRKTKIERKAA